MRRGVREARGAPLRCGEVCASARQLRQHRAGHCARAWPRARTAYKHARHPLDAAQADSAAVPWGTAAIKQAALARTQALARSARTFIPIQRSGTDNSVRCVRVACSACQQRRCVAAACRSRQGDWRWLEGNMLASDAVSTWHAHAVSRIVDTASIPHGRVSVCVSGAVSTDCLYIVPETR